METNQNEAVTPVAASVGAPATAVVATPPVTATAVRKGKAPYTVPAGVTVDWSQINRVIAEKLAVSSATVAHLRARLGIASLPKGRRWTAEEVVLNAAKREAAAKLKETVKAERLAKRAAKVEAKAKAKADKAEARANAKTAKLMAVAKAKAEKLAAKEAAKAAKEAAKATTQLPIVVGTAPAVEAVAAAEPVVATATVTA